MHQGNTTFTTEEIEIHIRTYRSLLKSAGSIKISQLIDSHLTMDSILHEKKKEDEIDMAAFIYVLLRLPTCASSVKNIILGQSFDVFANNGFSKIESWQEVEAPGRRRKMFYDGKETLAIYIASVTDVDDLVTLLAAFQIEWNKFHQALSQPRTTTVVRGKVSNVEAKVNKLLAPEDIQRVRNIWGKDYLRFLTAIKKRRVDFTVRLLSGSYVEYAKATQHWWNHVVTSLPQLDIPRRPIYFVSSNTHSITNLLTHFVVSEEQRLVDYLYKTKDTSLIQLWEQIKSGDFLANKENFLYYLAKKYAKWDPSILEKKKTLEKKLGIHTVPASHYLDIDTQVIEVKKLVKKSEALIINIDYPLGWAAYQVLTEIGQNISSLRGIFIMGKAATLNGQIGDILIPTSVFDQHTKNIYAISNAFAASDFGTIFKTGSVLDRQKTVCVKGTFLENKKLIKSWYQEGYTIIEMETGPYLNATYEFVYYNRYMENQFINLTNTPFELGIAHYASDTPYSKAKNLGVRNLSYEGVEPTYAISLAIIQKIIQREMQS